jgi:glycosyltransferase involved in cell wall biosynthesis
MRALFFIHELGLNGAVIALLHQVRALRARGHAVTIVTGPLDGGAPLEAAFRDTGAAIAHDLPADAHDVAIGCTVFAADRLNELTGKIPTAWWIHEGRAGIQAMFDHPAWLPTVLRVDKLIFPSRGVVERIWTPFLGQALPGRVEVVPNIVPPPAPGGPARRRPGLHGRVVCVGTVCPKKRQVDLVLAVGLLNRPPVECVLIGDNLELEPTGHEVIRLRSDQFVLTGPLPPDSVAPWYRSCEAFCLPSGDECMPLAPLEAASYGVAPVLADLECYEGVWRHGVNALMYPTGDVELLAWNLRMLIESPSLRARLGAEARKVPLRFAKERAAALFESALEEAIAAFSLNR